MTTKHYCDRCGKEMTGNKVLWTFFWFRDSSHLEFCQDCQSKFRRFIRNGKEKK